MANTQDLLGQRFGRWLVIDSAPPVPRKNRMAPCWSCRCDCGTIRNVREEGLTSGKSTSCGCKQRESAAAGHFKHGQRKHPLYRIWGMMRQRCSNPNNQKYPLYGGRGIRVCARWDDFMAFVADMGPRPDGHTLDRIDVNGNYEPSNCRWATSKEQSFNRRVTIVVDYHGEKISAQELASREGVSSKRLYKVMSTRGLSPLDAVDYVKAHRRPAISLSI